MNTVLICGGEIEDSFALSFLDRIRPEYIIGIDRGLEFCYKYNIVPQYILGDFDSISPEVLSYYESRDIPLERYKPEKDATDTRIGLELALKLKSRKIFLLGATGGRLDIHSKLKIPSASSGAGMPAMDSGHSECYYSAGPGNKNHKEPAVWKIYLLFFHGRQGGGSHSEGI